MWYKNQKVQKVICWKIFVCVLSEIIYTDVIKYVCHRFWILILCLHELCCFWCLFDFIMCRDGKASIIFHYPVKYVKWELPVLWTWNLTPEELCEVITHRGLLYNEYATELESELKFFWILVHISFYHVASQTWWNEGISWWCLFLWGN